MGFRETGEVDYPNCTRPYRGLPFLERVERYIDYTHTRALEYVTESACLAVCAYTLAYIRIKWNSRLVRPTFILISLYILPASQVIGFHKRFSSVPRDPFRICIHSSSPSSAIRPAWLFCKEDLVEQKVPEPRHCLRESGRYGCVPDLMAVRSLALPCTCSLVQLVTISQDARVLVS